MKKSFPIILLALVTVLGCTKTEQLDNISYGNPAVAGKQSKSASDGNQDDIKILVTLPGQLPQTQTKTANVSDGAGSYRFEWSDDDKINVSGTTFALSQKSSGQQAVFTGAAPAGKSFNILYPATLTESTFDSADFSSYTQNGNGSYAHVPCMFFISNVDTYEYVTVSSEWAGSHGGGLKMTGCLKLVIKLPASGISSASKVELVADSDIFHSTNNASSSTPALSLNLSSAALSSDVLTAYVPLSCNRIDFAEDTELTVKVYASGNLLFVKKFKPGRQSIEPGAVNEMVITGDGWDPVSSCGTVKGGIDNPYTVASVADLKGVASKLVAGRTVYFKQTADIDLGSTSFTPINTSVTTTAAINYDGGGKTISNFKCTGSYASLFGVINGCVCNLKIINAMITGDGSTSCGVVAGCLGDIDDKQTYKGILENITVTSSTVTGTSSSSCFIGGLVGEARNSVIRNCVFGDSNTSVQNTSSEADSGTGGLLGRYMACNEITNCTVHGTVTSSARNTGGVIGFAYGQAINISGCTCDANVSGSADAVGGFIGSAYRGCELDNCTVKSIVSSSASTGHCGGFVGIANGSNNSIGAIFHSCSFTGNVTASAGPYAGGFVGCSFKSVYCDKCTCGASSNTVQATSYSGGLAGAVLDYSAANSSTRYISAFLSVLQATDTQCAITVKAVSTTDDKNGCAGGLAGFVQGKVVAQRSCYSGNVSGYKYIAGLVGYTKTGPVTVENCYTTGTVSASNGYSAGLMAELPNNSTISRCYSTATVIGFFAAGGLVGRAFGGQGSTASVSTNVNTSITDCIAWNDHVYNSTKISSEEVNQYYSCGGILGFSTTVNTLSNCYRNPAMTLECYADAISKYNELYDQDNADASHPLTEKHAATLYYPYHGKSAAAGATVSSVAGALNWDETIWDLSGSLPLLK